MGCEVYNIFFDFSGFCDFVCVFFKTVWRIMFLMILLGIFCRGVLF